MPPCTIATVSELLATARNSRHMLVKKIFENKIFISYIVACVDYLWLFLWKKNACMLVLCFSEILFFSIPAHFGG